MRNTKRPFTILIPNGTSPKNMGDLAMLESLVAIVRGQIKNARIILHSFDTRAYDENVDVDRIKPTLYEWAVFEKARLHVRVFRMLQLLVVLLALRFGFFGFIKRFVSPTLFELLDDYRHADLVIVAAGGYLRSKPGIKQSLNFIMQLVPFWVSSYLAKKTVVAPISFGPFSYSWQEKLASRALSGYRAVFAREEISYDRMKKNNIRNIIKSSDIALALPAGENPRSKRSKRPIVGYTIRTWFPKEKQLAFERQYAMALVRFARESGAVVQPIIQVDAEKFDESDFAVTKHVADIVSRKGINVLPIVRTNSLTRILRAYRFVDLLVGMRMHSNILAVTQGTPYVGISYEHKTTGISRQLLMGKYCIRAELVTEMRLYELIKGVFENRKELGYLLKWSTAQIKSELYKQWRCFFNRRPIREYRGVIHGVKKKIPTVTVALSAYNEEKNIRNFLQSLSRQEEDGYKVEKVVIVSDGSTDKTVEIIKRFRSLRLEVIDSRERLGKSARLNYIYSTLKSDILVQSDADVIFSHPHVIRDLIKPIIENRYIGMSGGNPQPLKGITYLEKAINCTVEAYIQLRHRIRSGNNIFSVDGRLLAFRRELVEKIKVPVDMIANDRYTYYCCLREGYEYAFSPSAIVLFRSPQKLADHIKQNTRFLAAPIRMSKYFRKEIIVKEESIPKSILVQVFFYQWIRHPMKTMYVFIVNRLCYLIALRNEKKLSARWDIAYTTKRVLQ